MKGGQGRCGTRRGLLLRAVAEVRRSAPFVRTLAALPTGKCVVLRYHSVSDDSGWAGDFIQPSLVVSPDDFDRQLTFLARHHVVVDIGELVEAVRAGERIDRRWVVITFDDGYEDNYRFAFPILMKHGMSAAFYVTTGCIGDRAILWTVVLRHAIQTSARTAIELSFLPGKPIDLSHAAARDQATRLLTGIVKRCAAREADEIVGEVLEACGVRAGTVGRRIIMDWDEIREMHEAGMTIGAHTVNHYNLPCLDERQMVREVTDSKRALEDGVGASVDHFAYPNGRTDRHFDDRVAQVVAKAGYRSAVTSVTGPASRRCSEFSIPRLGITPKHADLTRFAADIQYARFVRPRRCLMRESGLEVSAGELSEASVTSCARPSRAGGTGR